MSSEIRHKIIDGLKNKFQNIPATAITGLSGGGDALTANPLSQFAATSSSQLAGVLSDETGSGVAVFGTSPTIVTPTIASFANANHNHTNSAGGGQLTASTALNATGTPSSTTYLRGDNTWGTPAGGGGGDALTTNPLSQFAATTSTQLRGVLSDETGTGAAVFATSPTLVTPVLGTPASGNLVNCTGAPSPDSIIASDYSWKAWTFDPISCFAGGSLAGLAGYVFVTTIPIRAATTVSNIIMNVQVAGATLTSSQCLAGIYQGGTLLASTADQSAVWNSIGYKTMALTGAPISVAAGMLYVGFFANGTTLPQFSVAVSSAGNTPANTTGFKRGGFGSSGNTTAMPSSLGTVTAHNFQFFAAVS